MSPIESTGAGTLARGAPHAAHGAQKADALQGPTTAPAAAPVETAHAVTQSQSSEKSRLPPHKPTDERIARNSAAPPRGDVTLTKPMTAALLHELRLQQELADVQEEVSAKRD